MPFSVRLSRKINGRLGGFWGFGFAENRKVGGSSLGKTHSEFGVVIVTKLKRHFFS